MSAGLQGPTEEDALDLGTRQMLDSRGAMAGSATRNEADLDPLERITFALARPGSEQIAALSRAKLSKRVDVASIRASQHSAQRFRRRLALLVPASERLVAMLQMMPALARPMLPRALSLIAAISSEAAAAVWHNDAAPHP